MANPSPITFTRRQLGRRLRALRLEAGKTAVDTHHAQIAARAKLWRIETGQCTVKPGDVLAFCLLYRVDGPTTDELRRMAEVSAELNYQEDYVDVGVAERVSIYNDLEPAAAEVRAFKLELIDGLLQIPAYAREVIAAGDGLSDDEIEHRVQVRMRRQQAFFDRPDPGRLNLVIPAGVLDLAVGSAATMQEQIAHLRAVDERDEVSIRVLTPANGPHGYRTGPFTILDFDDPGDPPVIYVESLVGSRYIERPQQVAAFRQAFERIRRHAVPLREYRE